MKKGLKKWLIVVPLVVAVATQAGVLPPALLDALRLVGEQLAAV